jgi:hypothetical protein
VTIRDGDAPLGTHVYTAIEIADGGAAMRWTATSMPADQQSKPEPTTTSRRKGARRGHGEPPPPAAAPLPTAALAALDRIEIGKETLDRISELLTPGASLIISDQGLGPETGRGTDFIVVMR